MTQPSQVFPPWLTPSASTVTNAAGAPVATETTIVYLPLTYFGPSIPLGSLWTFGGSTSPASSSPSVVSTPLTTTAISSFTTTTTTAIPILSTSASTSISNTAIPISSTTPTSSSLLSSPITTSPSSSSAPSSTSSAAQISALTKGQLVGVIIASILGLIFLFVFALFLYLWCKGRENRRQFTTLVPPGEDEDYDVLSQSDVEGYHMAGDAYSAPEGYRVPGEGSPRHSGDEASSFLRKSRGGGGGPSFAETSAAGAAAAMSQVPAAMAVSHAIPRIPPPTNSNSSGSRSSNSHASGFGVLLDRPGQGLGYLPSMPEYPQGHRSALSDADMQRLNEENVLPDDSDMYEDGEYTGAYAYSADPLLVPPRIVDPDSSPAHPHFPSGMSDLSEAEVLTAERRTVSSLIGSQPPKLPELPGFSGETTPRASGGLLGAIGLGLGGLANLGRRSWFRSFDSNRHSPDFTIEPFTEKDLEMGRAMLSPAGIMDSRGRGVGAGPDGTRPKSSSSARSGTSGGTIYHDAYSSTPGTPLLPPLPRAATPAAPVESSVTESVWLTSPPSRPPAYDTAQSPGFTHNLSLGLNFAPGSDILDMPAPAALPHFASVSSLKETATGSSLGLKTPVFPPGLDTIRPIGWSDAATDVTASSPAASAFGGIFSGFNNSLGSSGRITIDLLEDAPPGAEVGWRSIASTGFGDAGRRGTFGLFIEQSGFMSEQGSLHSMRSHINPSVRSTGSAPASRRDGTSSTGSASSRPSAHSLARTGSISSDGRRRNHANSPTLSAFGGGGYSSQMRPSPLSKSNSNSNSHHRSPLDDLSSSTMIGVPPPCAHVGSDKTSTIRSLGSAGSVSVAATVMDSSFATVRRAGPVDRSTSPLSASFPLNAPWAAGLDNDWTPAA